MSSYIVFDFDGTLADMKQLILEIANEIATKRGWQTVDDAMYDKLRRGSVREGIKMLNLPLRELPFLLLEGKRMLSLRTGDITFFAGIVDLINHLHTAGHELYVLSANSQKIIQETVDRHGVGDKLTVLPSSSIFGKAGALKKFIRKQKLNKDDVWMVGDELRDMEAAQKAGTHSIAVTWGLQHPDTLRAALPTFVVDKPADIASCLQQS